MSTKSLELARFSLTMKSEKLKVEVVSTVDIKFPSGWNLCRDDASILDALTSGHVWASRGSRCRVQMEFFLNSKPLDQNFKIALLDALGYHLCDAQLWSQLSLSTAVRFPQSDQNADFPGDISIYINHALAPSEMQPKAWLDNIDIKAPDSVVCAEFECLHIRYGFHQIQDKPQVMAKRIKSGLPQPDSANIMLLDSISDLESNTELTNFENVVAVLREDLSSTIAGCLNKRKSHRRSRPAHLVDKVPLLPDLTGRKQRDSIGMPSVISVCGAAHKRRFPKKVVEELQAWLQAHPGNMSPSNGEVLQLMQRTGLERVQIRSWFGYVRRRNKFPASISSMTESIKPQSNMSDSLYSPQDDVDMLLLQCDDEMFFDEKYSEADVDEMLLSHATSTTTPSWIAQPSTISTTSSIRSTKRPSLDNAIDSESTPIYTKNFITPAKELTSFALRTLIAGPSNRKRDLQGIQIRKAPLSIYLSAIVPSIFCPGFKGLMAQNSKFLPTISNTICSSVVRNVQGAVLRQNLIALSNGKVSAYHDGDGEQGSAGRLANVVQARLWRMMQRTLWNEDAVKKLWKRDEVSMAEDFTRKEDDCEDDDLLGNNSADRNIDTKEDFLDECTLEEFMNNDEESLFEDLLSAEDDRENDDDLLHYFQEQERLAVEAETEEMLFGSEGDLVRCAEVGQEEETLFLEDDSYVERMLV